MNIVFVSITYYSMLESSRRKENLIKTDKNQGVFSSLLPISEY